ncbi:MAG TPA: hypothetical protein VHB21_08935 [Minicystis sp.]|nr:hypothetical protein [Minicystis sp.]
MPRTIENTGDIETNAVPDPARVGDTVALTFRSDTDPTPPFQLRVRAPSGKLIVESVLRELPTSVAQSGKPVTFVVSTAGDYKIEIKQLTGKQRGEAIFHVLT